MRLWKKAKREGRIRKGEAKLATALSVRSTGMWSEVWGSKELCQERALEKRFHHPRAVCCALDGTEKE